MPSTSGSSTRTACSSSSWPVSSPSRTMIFSASGIAQVAAGSRPSRPSSVARSSSAAITNATCSSKSTPELLGARAHRVAVDGGREGRRLHLLLDRLGRHAVDALGPHVRARHHEAGQLVDRVQRLLHRRVARAPRGSRRARRPRARTRARSPAPPAPSGPPADGRSRGRDGARSRGRGACRRGPSAPRPRRSAGRRRACAASTARTWRRSDSDAVQEQKRSQA